MTDEEVINATLTDEEKARIDISKMDEYQYNKFIKSVRIAAKTRKNAYTKSLSDPLGNFYSLGVDEELKNILTRTGKILDGLTVGTGTNWETTTYVFDTQLAKPMLEEEYEKFRLLFKREYNGKDYDYVKKAHIDIEENGSRSMTGLLLIGIDNAFKNAIDYLSTDPDKFKYTKPTEDNPLIQSGDIIYRNLRYLYSDLSRKLCNLLI